ncbi:unnamed protein product [Diplocarpon coronariae]|nr:hypothetical protein JHW43_009056 [Diplocarpon mali]
MMNPNISSARYRAEIIAGSCMTSRMATKSLDKMLSAVALCLSIPALMCYLATGSHAVISTASTILLPLSIVRSVTARES